MEMKDIKDPFIRQLIDEMGVTGLHIYKNDRLVRIVGHPTQKKLETHHEMLKRWSIWTKQHDLIASGRIIPTKREKVPQGLNTKSKKSYTVSHKISSKQSCPR